MIYLDTHVVAWLYAGLLDKFSPSVKNLLNENEILISPIVRMELQYLYEIGRLREPSEGIITDLSERIGLAIDVRDFNTVASQALALTWTRDPFDRLIVAQAQLSESILISKDQNLLDHYPHARW